MMDEAQTALAVSEERKRHLKHHYMRGHDDGKLFSIVKCKNKIGSIIQQHRRESVINQIALREEMSGLEWAFALIQEVEQEIRQTCMAIHLPPEPPL
jgi:hypothetical protein